MARIPVDRKRENIAALVEYVLPSVAVMVIDVEDRHPRRAVVAEPLSGDRSVVDVAISAHERGAGMVAWRPAEREGRPLTFPHETRGRERHVVRRFDGFPRAFDESCSRVE